MGLGKKEEISSRGARTVSTIGGSAELEYPGFILVCHFLVTDLTRFLWLNHGLTKTIHSLLTGVLIRGGFGSVKFYLKLESVLFNQ